MATANLTLTVTASALARQAYPNTPQANPPVAVLKERNYNNYLYLRLSEFPANLKRQRLYQATFTVGYQAGFGTSGQYYDLTVESSDDFDPATLTYVSRPTPVWIAQSVTIRESDSSPAVFPTSRSTAEQESFKTSQFLQNKALALYASSRYDSDYIVPLFQVYTQAYTQGITPSLEIQYDDTLAVNYEIIGSLGTSGYLNPHRTATLSWRIERNDSYYCVEPPVQASAIVQWRSHGGSTWNEISVPGSTQICNVPAETWPVGTVEWRVRVTDDVGTVRLSQIYTVSTTAGLLTATPLSPIGMIAVDETKSTTLSWELSGTSDQTAADVGWSADSGATWHNLHVTGYYRNVIVPANTFPAAVITWRVRAYNVDDVAGNYSTANFTTIDSPSISTPYWPVDTVVAKQDEMTLRWETQNTSGSLPTGADVQWSNDGTSWQDMGSTSGQQTLTVPGNYFPSGKIYWRVRSYNRNHTAGPWSDAATFISYGAPNAPTVSATSVNYTTVSWAADDQASYRVTIDGALYGPFWGTDKSFTVDDPISFGIHTVSVVVQNEVGLWSQPGTVTFTVTRGGGASPVLTGHFRTDAALSWSVAVPDALTGLFVYRDGVRIASLDYSQGSGVFVDRHVLGEHRYQIIGRWRSDYAIYSDVITGRMCAKCPLIAPLAGGEWLTLRLSETAERSQAFNSQRAVSLRHFSGAEFPVAEIGPYRDISGSYEAAFADREQAEVFEALFGQVVILKTRGDKVLVGVMSNLDTRVTKHYFAYTFTVQQIYWRDYVDAAGD